jgi:hypothetical protein
LTKRYGAGVLVSESAYREIPHPEKYCCRQVDVVQVKGKTQPVGIYEIFDADAEPLKTQKLQGLAAYHQALILFHSNDWQAAQRQFEACLQLCPSDPVVRVYLERCREYTERHPTVEWRGVTVLQEK